MSKTAAANEKRGRYWRTCTLSNLCARAARCKQLRARLATRGGRFSPSACIYRWAGRTCLFSAIFKN